MKQANAQDGDLGTGCGFLCARTYATFDGHAVLADAGVQIVRMEHVMLARMRLARFRMTSSDTVSRKARSDER